MEEAVIFQRRNRLKKHFVNTSNVLLYGYQTLSDAAKITYQVIDGFDWESKDTGASKGYVFPAVETLAKIRHTTDRTIRRHINELVDVKLLSRQRRRYKPSILFIEEISEKEINSYLIIFVDKKGEEPKIGERFNPRMDKNVRSQQHPEWTKMSVQYKKENEVLKENEINVNENFKSSKTKTTENRDGQITSLGTILAKYGLKRPKIKEKPETILKRDYLAQEMAEKLNDEKSLGCYRVIADKIPQPVIFEVLGSVKETAIAGKIKESRGALFVEIIKQYAQKKEIELGFKNRDPFENR